MNPLTDLIPAKYRKYLYAAVSLAAVVYGLYEAADGDWKQFAVALIGFAASALAHANTNTNQQPPTQP